MENQHNVTLAIGRPARLILELDERVLLTFTGEDLSKWNVCRRDSFTARGTPAIRLVFNSSSWISDYTVVPV